TSRQRRPDIAFVSSERWPIDRPTSLRDDAWDVVPVLAVEVISPTDRASDLLDKVIEYFQAGIRLVWIVYPSQRCIHVFEAWNRVRALRRPRENNWRIPFRRAPWDTTKSALSKCSACELFSRVRLTESDTLDGGAVLPGFQLALDRLFD